MPRLPRWVALLSVVASSLAALDASLPDVERLLGASAAAWVAILAALLGSVARRAQTAGSTPAGVTWLGLALAACAAVTAADVAPALTHALGASLAPRVATFLALLANVLTSVGAPVQGEGSGSSGAP